MNTYPALNEALKQQIDAGNESARQEMMRLNLGLVWKKAWEMEGSYDGPEPAPTLDEWFSAGCVGLANACKRIEKCKHSNIVGYLAKSIVREMRRATCREHPLADTAAEGIQLRQLSERQHRAKVDRCGIDPMTDIENREQLEAILAPCKDEIDVQIVQMKMEEYSLREIAKEVGRSLSNVRDRWDCYLAKMKSPRTRI